MVVSTGCLVVRGSYAANFPWSCGIVSTGLSSTHAHRVASVIISRYISNNNKNWGVFGTAISIRAWERKHLRGHLSVSVDDDWVNGMDEMDIGQCHQSARNNSVPRITLVINERTRSAVCPSTWSKGTERLSTYTRFAPHRSGECTQRKRGCMFNDILITDYLASPARLCDVGKQIKGGSPEGTDGCTYALGTCVNHCM